VFELRQRFSYQRFSCNGFSGALRSVDIAGQTFEMKVRRMLLWRDGLNQFSGRELLVFSSFLQLMHLPCLPACKVAPLQCGTEADRAGEEGPRIEAGSCTLSRSQPWRRAIPIIENPHAPTIRRRSMSLFDRPELPANQLVQPNGKGIALDGDHISLHVL